LRRFAPAAALLVLLAAGCGNPLEANDEGDKIYVGALEDVVKQPDPAIAEERVRLAEEAGLDALNITTPWEPGQTEPTDEELLRLRNVATAAQKHRIRVIISIFTYRNRFTPQTDEDRDQFAQLAANLARELPSVRDFVIGNEPNLNGFWFPQLDESGKDVASPAYTALLARAYDELKAVSPKILVYGGALAPRGADNPDAQRHTQSPTAFIQGMGKAYRDSGRDKPLMDVFAIHPYLERSKIPPDTEHPIGTAIGIADYDKLVRLLGEAFDGTAQKGSDVPIAYTEFGVQSEIPPEHQDAYTNLDSPIGLDAVPEETQAEYYAQAFELAACQETVTGFLVFHLSDEPDLNRWQSGMYYYDLEPKSSLEPIREAAEEAREGKADCPDD
jgi:hypothetical protein